MRKLLKKCLAAALVLFVSIITMPAVYAGSLEARNISIFRVDGQNVSLTRAPGGRAVEPRAGQRLSEGNILSTGWDSQVYVQLDDASILKMDESTRVQVGAARSLLSLSVQSGSALVDVTAQSPGQALETRIGNTALTVRGTLYIMSRQNTDVVTITMLSGAGEVTMRGDDGLMTQMPLPAGFMMWVYDVLDGAALEGQEDVWQAYRIGILDVNELNLFELEEIINRQEYLLEVGVLTPEMLEDAFVAVEARSEERDAIREIYIAASEYEVEVERILMPGDGAAEAVDIPAAASEESSENGYTSTPYITIRGVRIRTDLTVLNLNTHVGGSSGQSFDFTDEEITPLRYMVNLRSLTITRSYISDLTPLADLVNLSNLRLSDNYRLTDLTPLADLVSLTDLNLQDNQITSIDPLRNLVGLRSLNLNSNFFINDIEPISSLTGLEELSLFRNSVSDLAPLRFLTSLTHLDLSDNLISDLTHLENLINLTDLNLVDNNNIVSVWPLGNLNSLTRLDLWRNNIDNLAPLATLTNLTFLGLGDNNISVITPLGSLINLEELFLDGNQIMEISALANLAALRLLNLSGNPGIDIWDWSYVDHVPVVLGRFMHGLGFGGFLPGYFEILQELCESDNEIDGNASGTYYCYEEYKPKNYSPGDYNDDDKGHNGGKYGYCEAITKEDDEYEYDEDDEYEDFV